MTRNDVLRRVRYALNISTQEVIEVFRLAGYEIKQSGVTSLVKKEEEEGYAACTDEILSFFLDGLIIKYRGPRGTEREPETSLSNNLILKKLRIALQLKDDDILQIFKLANMKVSKTELSALFRAEGQDNYVQCRDQMLRNFLKGLTIRYRDKA